MWILDSGATDHTCCILTCFQSYTTISPLQVKLPNGNTVMSSISRTIQLTDTLQLHDELYLPNFNFNLVLVSKLALNNSC